MKQYRIVISSTDEKVKKELDKLNKKIEMWCLKNDKTKADWGKEAHTALIHTKGIAL